jgi:large subunit ribosomal protein L21
MYAIVQLGSQQYKISEGDMIEAQKIEAEDGKKMSLDSVVFYSDGDRVEIGQPFVKGIKVSAQVVRQTKDDKVISFKHWRRKDKSWKKGHRQKLTALNILKIEASL